MLDSSFSLCIRGNGNFSYRFYEALSFGRIPILIDTDVELPFESIINWKDHIIFIKPDMIKDIGKIIDECTISPIENRKLWCKYFSAEGYNNNFIYEL